MSLIKIASRNRIFSPRIEAKLIERHFPLGLEDDANFTSINDLNIIIISIMPGKIL